MEAFKYLFFFSLSFLSFNISAETIYACKPDQACKSRGGSSAYIYRINPMESPPTFNCIGGSAPSDLFIVESCPDPDPDPEPEPEKCEPGIVPLTLKVPVSSGKMVCVDSCQYSISKCVDVDFEAGMTCDGVNEGRECGTPPPTTTPTTSPVTQDPTNPTDKTDEQKTFENIMHVIGEKLDGIKDAITGGNQNQNGGDTGGSNGGTTGGDVTVNVDMSETNAKIDETNSLIDELTKWLQGEDLGDDIFGDSEPPEKELTPQQLDTSIFSSRSQCPADARLSFNLLGGKTFTKTFEFKDWCDNLEIFGSLILIASYLFGAYIIVSKS
ncbi:virulence factor TspB C-terminal domain-related protein [Acinetobacter johnsonii]|uniref:virulence factor TspB C-terminal domain-related protein n=1 Tax=Acinetobacter johnsonii TaxID=40214 RepID=UPI002FD9DEE4|nr:virulence factor TspB C-terminal domain-related protein [Acinetobacter johnsonii]WQN52040.1 virulence factor TspB C-terminal domain-related protein [Acinetobacter johnsonii]